MKLSIDVSKIDKSKLYQGKKGLYLDVVLIPTPNNQYGDTHMIVQGLSKEERDAGKKGNILGNVKGSAPKAEPEGGGFGESGKEAFDSSGPVDESIPF